MPPLSFSTLFPRPRPFQQQLPKKQQQQQQQRRRRIVKMSCFSLLLLSRRAMAMTMTIPTTRRSLMIDSKPIHFIMAPMVSASDAPFRQLCRNYGVDLCYTQMLHARLLVQTKSFQRNHFDFIPYDDLLPSQQICIAGMEQYHQKDRQESGPLIVQLAGSDPTIMVDAAQILIQQAPNIVTGIDVNLGCPQGIARKGNYGAFLMEQEEDHVMTILTTLRQQLPSHISVSAKVRLPLTDKAMTERMVKLMNTGIDFITIHGRTLQENKTLVRAVHTDRMRLAIDTCRSVRHDIPVVANGGIEHYSDVQRMIQQTGASAMMSSEGLLETPNLFQGPSPTHPRDMFQQQVKFAREYIMLAAQSPPLPGTCGMEGGSFNVVRGHLFKILHRYLQPHLREQLVQMQSLLEALAWLEELETWFDTDDKLINDTTTSWYRRHWAANARIEQLRTPKPLAILTNQEKKKAMQLRIATLKAERGKDPMTAV